MAVMPYYHAYFMALVKKHGLSGDLLTYGRQDAYGRQDLLETRAREVGFPLTCVDPELARRLEAANPMHPSPNAQIGLQHGVILMNDQIYFRQLGFRSVTSMDAHPFEACTRVFDMNNHGVPEDLKGAFDVSMDLGTIEHVFHLPNFLLNDFQMLKLGGLAFHLAPMNNFANHGFYQISPTLLNDFYQANGFEILERHILKIFGDHWSDRLETYALAEQQYVAPLARLDNEFYYSAILVRKTTRSTGDHIAQQYAYAQGAWK